MKRLVSFVLSLVILVTVDLAVGVTLSRNGVARLPIVIHPDASDAIKDVADEFREYLDRMTGASFQVRVGQGGDGIFVGTKEQFPLPKFADALAIRPNRDGVESFVIHRCGRSLYLVGATELGTSHAVFRCLERLGCRWFFPAKAWEVIPEKPALAMDFDEVSRPKIASRRIWWGYGFFDRRRKNCQQDYEAWARHNRMARSLRNWNGHAWQTIIRENQAAFDQHPEYLALVDGKRRGPQFCVSNPEVRAIATKWALGRIERDPQMHMVSMETSDGLHQCECEPCLKMGSVSDRAFGLANEVARAIDKAYPGKMVGMLAYSDHCEPPSFALEPNVYVQSTAGFIHGSYTFEELMKLWPRKTKNIGFYEYFSVWLWDFDQLPGGRGNDISYIARRIREYAAVGATSITCESGNNWGLHGRGYYVANKLMWNPDEDVDTLLADFYKYAFGPAADVMRRYYERFDRGDRPLMSEHLLAQGYRDLNEATKSAINRPDVQARLNHIKQYMHYVRIKWDLDHLPRTDVARRKQLTLDGITWCYRTRYSYMNHWAAMWQGWTSRAADEFDEPSWSFRFKGEQPWKVETPVTAEETERAFQADLERFQPEDVTERNFSTTLKWPRLRNEYGKQVRSQPLLHSYQRAKRYAVASPAGEPIRLRVTTGIIKHYRDRADNRWVVTNEDGTEIDKGRLPQDGQNYSLEIAVPHPGIYWFDYNDQAAGWRIEADNETPIAFAIECSERILHLGQFRQPIFFYVPRTTKRVQFFWEGGNLNPRVHGPDGTMLHEVTENGRYVSVDVPQGADGKPWHFTRFAPRRIWFTNVPNYLSSSPEQLLIPEDAD